MLARNREGLGKAVEKFVTSFDPNFRVMEGDRYEANLTKNTIIYDVERGKIDEYYYISNLYRMGGEKIPLLGHFMWMLLHELGHLITRVDEKGEEQEYLLAQFFLDQEITREDYFTLPSEKAATQWAIQYVLENKKEAEKWNELFELYL